MLAECELMGAVGWTSSESHSLTRCCCVCAENNKEMILYLGARIAASPTFPRQWRRRAPACSAGRSVTPRLRLSAPEHGSHQHATRPSCPVPLHRESVSANRHSACCRRTIQKQALESPLTVLFSSYSFFAPHSISEKELRSHLQNTDRRGRGELAHLPAFPVLLLLLLSEVNWCPPGSAGQC